MKKITTNPIPPIRRYSKLVRMAGRFMSCCFLLCTSCNNAVVQNEKYTSIAVIDSFQKKMFDSKSMQLDKNLALQGISAYITFAEKYPNDSVSAEYLFRASDLSRAVGDNNKAILTLDKICKQYPSYKKISECIFLQGYYYQEYFKDTTKAKEYYNLLLAKYPKHPFANDAKALMSMFGKTDEQMIKEFEQKAAEKKI